MPSHKDFHPTMTVKVNNKGEHKSLSPASPKEKKSIVEKKRGNVHLSTSFMDALGPASTPEPIKKKPRKAVVNGEKDKKKHSKRHHKERVDDVLAGIYDTMDRSTAAVSRSPSPPLGKVSPPAHHNKAPLSKNVEVSCRVRKIRFRDEHGGELVEVKFFDVEEGERVNVFHLTADEKRNLEHGMESGMGKQMRSTVDEDEDLMEVEVKQIKWRLVEVTNARRDLPTGSKSQERMIEANRQRSALEVLYMPDCSNDRISEPDLQDMRQNNMHKVKIIPMEQIFDVPSPAASNTNPNVAQSPEYNSPTSGRSPTPENQSPPRSSPSPTMATVHSIPTFSSVAKSHEDTPVPKTTVLPGHLQNLLQGLQRTGILSGGTSAVQPIQQVLPAPSIYAQDIVQQTPIIAQIFPEKHAISQSHSYSQLHMPPTSSVMKILTNVDPHSIPAAGDPISSPYVVPSTSAPLQIQRPVHTTTTRVPFNGHKPYVKQCNAFASSQGCSYGDRCRFAHGDKLPNPAFQHTRPAWRGRGLGNRANAGVYNGPAL